MSSPPDLPAHLGRVVDHAPLHGGDIATAWVVTTDDGDRFVVKATPYDASLEAEGLQALEHAGAPVPSVHHVADDLLVMDHVSGSPDLPALGAALARAHGAPTADTGFGWHRDNLLGTVPQVNTPAADWPTFFVTRRIEPHLDTLGGSGRLPPGVAARLVRACDGALPDLLDHDVQPSLVHGDLWPGNVVDDCWLVDPAVHRADAEADLAAAALFGGLPDAFFDGYVAERPLDVGWQQRRLVLQLPHLLAHVRMFGGGWVGGVAARLDRLGW